MIKKLSAEVLRKHKGVSFVGVSTCFFCHDGKGKFLMAKRSANARDERGKWDNGGGGLKWGNTLTQNVKKEIAEEYNAQALTIEFLGYRDVFRSLPDGAKTHWLAMDFAVLVNPSDVRINEPDMVDELGWFTLSRLPSPLHSQMPVIFKKYKNRLEQVFNNKAMKEDLS